MKKFREIYVKFKVSQSSNKSSQKNFGGANCLAEKEGERASELKRRRSTGQRWVGGKVDHVKESAQLVHLSQARSRD